MATPLTADQIVAVLRAEGVTVAEHSGWRTHNRAGHGAWGPVHGVVIHHTAGTDSLEFCYDGRSDLPGPLCHTHLAKTGIATMVANGRANHAGTFAQNAYDAAVNESSTHPRPDAVEPVDGNAHFYGIEIENLGNGKDPYPAVQYDAAVRWAAAICRAHSWSAESVIGHKEGTRRKTDPSFSMTTFRADVAERLTHPADWNPTEDDMPLTDAEWTKLEGLLKTVVPVATWTTDGIVKNPNPATVQTNPFIAPATGLNSVEIVARRTDANVAALIAQVAALSAALSKLAEGGGIDAATIQAAAEAGAKAALQQLGDAIDATT